MGKITNRGVKFLLPTILLSAALSSLLVSIYTAKEIKALKTHENDLKREVVVLYTPTENDKAKEDSWNDFISALVWVESKGDCNAIGSKDDMGVLQIRTPIVDDCNRILGYNRFTYEDRLDSLKSVQMFNVIQDHYNPSHDKHFALKIWNSKAPISYHRKVIRKLGEIENARKNKNNFVG